MEYDTKIEAEWRKAFEYLEKLINSGARVEVKQIRKNRSKWQNKWYYVVVKQISDYTGYELDETKVLIKRNCGLVYENKGQVFLRSTTDLDTKEFSEFMDRVVRWAAKDVGLTIPDPKQ